jgi:hypothetical protein
VRVKRQVVRDEVQIIGKQCPQPPSLHFTQRPSIAPEQPVVHKYKLGSAFKSKLK